MRQYNVGDRVVLDFSRCYIGQDYTPGGLYFPTEWRSFLQGKIVTIKRRWILDQDISPLVRYSIEEVFRELYQDYIAIDEYCISDAMTIFNTDGLKELI